MAGCENNFIDIVKYLLQYSPTNIKECIEVAKKNDFMELFTLLSGKQNYEITDEMMFYQILDDKSNEKKKDIRWNNNNFMSLFHNAALKHNIDAATSLYYSMISSFNEEFANSS